MAFLTWRVSSSACLAEKDRSCLKGRRTRGLVVRLVGTVCVAARMARQLRTADEACAASGASRVACARDLLDAGVLVGERVGQWGRRMAWVEVLWRRSGCREGHLTSPCTSGRYRFKGIWIVIVRAGARVQTTQ